MAVNERLTTLTNLLCDACRAYYSDTDEDPIMSDKEYDKLIRELTLLEQETGESLPWSPTKNVGFAEETPDKMQHIRPILSLKDTKSIDELLHFLGEEEGMLSWKLDGLSVVLYYEDGVLVNAMTRGDGLTGKVIFENAKKMRYVPHTIQVKGRLVVRGEGCLALKDFEAIKKTKQGERFSNPRNLAAGIINTTKAPNVLLRHMAFIAHSIIFSDGEAAALTTRTAQLEYLSFFEFHVVPHSKVLNFELQHEVERYTKSVDKFPYPVDGLVLALDNLAYGESLGATAKFPRHSMAFKWPDESALTKVTGMKWSVSQTGLITPVVIFEPIELEGTIVRQANLHNLKFFEDLSIGKGDILKVYKANKIIPEVEENMTRSKTERYPRKCPVCGGPTRVAETERTRKLYCDRCGKK